ncbi:MAG: class I SAM-dependent RNA methyltransferase [Defluviitaleaceae bacterium]|nr:class I SAM-dependent RNA methyltransferase [Defluviitaleaceae bacterium]
MDKLNLIATATFGLEATVKREVARLGYDITSTADGRIDFAGDAAAIARSNIWLRAADRVLLKVGEFKAATFDELFDQTKALPWEDFIPQDGQFIVNGKSIKSGLFSVPDCQSIVKKAVAERLKIKYAVEWMPETGPIYKIQVALLKDVATLTIDTTGDGLHKRGYRAITSAAPIKETLAAAMIELSYWRKNRPLLDPMCGSGTIAIEAALMAKNMAPGLNRAFVAETWPQIPSKAWADARDEARGAIYNGEIAPIYASDVDAKLVTQARDNAKKAGVAQYINFDVADVTAVSLPGEYGVMITNPPYGQRIGQEEQLHRIYAQLQRLLPKGNTWSVYVITSDEEFQQHFGRKADARRKLFNGATKAEYYQYHGPRPPKGNEPVDN